jgi:hypothetical protein
MVWGGRQARDEKRKGCGLDYDYDYDYYYHAEWTP